MRRHFLWVLIGGLLGLGCAATPGGDQASRLRLQYPESQYISAIGISGSSLDEAKKNAMAEVSAQISSRIESETVVIAQAISRGEQVTDTQSLSSSVRTHTRFKRAELIRIDKSSLGRKDGLYQALAYLSRREYFDILEAEYQSQRVVFHENAGSLPRLTDNLPAYTAAYGLMRDAFTAMATQACDIQAVTRDVYEPWQADQQTMSQAEAARGALLRDLKLAVRVDDCEGISGETLAGVIRSSLSQAGVGTLGAECQPDGLQLHLTPSLSWTRLVGKVCALKLDGGLQTCTGEVLMELSLEDKALRGDGRAPEAKLMQRVTPQLMSTLLLERIGHVVPVF